MFIFKPFVTEIALNKALIFQQRKQLISGHLQSNVFAVVKLQITAFIFSVNAD